MPFKKNRNEQSYTGAVSNKIRDVSRLLNPCI
jgi:hypothetical protein